MSEFTFPDTASECECCCGGFDLDIEELCLARNATDLVCCTRLKAHRGPHIAHGVKRHLIVLAWANRGAVPSGPRLPLEDRS